MSDYGVVADEINLTDEQRERITGSKLTITVADGQVTIKGEACLFGMAWEVNNILNVILEAAEKHAPEKGGCIITSAVMTWLDDQGFDCTRFFNNMEEDDKDAENEI